MLQKRGLFAPSSRSQPPNAGPGSATPRSAIASRNQRSILLVTS